MCTIVTYRLVQAFVHTYTHTYIHLNINIIAHIESGVPHNPQLVYFAIEDEFEEVLEHIDRAERRFALHLTRYNCGIAQAS
jgi:hypothetical protein